MTPRALVEEWVRRFNAADVAGLAALYHDDAVNHQVVQEPVSTLDLAATFYDYVGLPKPDAMQSRSLRPLLAGQRETRDMVYSEWHVHPSRCGVGLKLRTVRTGTHKCTFELDSGAGELYDLVHDPEEMVNRFRAS